MHFKRYKNKNEKELEQTVYSNYSQLYLNKVKFVETVFKNVVNLFSKV